MQVDEEGRRSCAPSSSTPPAICTCKYLNASPIIKVYFCVLLLYGYSGRRLLQTHYFVTMASCNRHLLRAHDMDP